MSPTVLEGAIRSGCTHLVVDLLLGEEERQQLATCARLVAAVRHMRRPDAWAGLPAPPAMVVSDGRCRTQLLNAVYTQQCRAIRGRACPGSKAVSTH